MYYVVCRTTLSEQMHNLGGNGLRDGCTDRQKRTKKYSVCDMQRIFEDLDWWEAVLCGINEKKSKNN